MNSVFFRTVSILLLLLLLSPVQGAFAGSSFDTIETDTPNRKMFGFFDLRDRETYIQITNLNPGSHNIHIQLFDVSNDCNENDFFDVYTPNDTHTYNIRDIQTNDGTPSGVVLPEGAYGIFVAFGEFTESIIGNIRILDNNGYEYRSNIPGTDMDINTDGNNLEEFATFNFNAQGGVLLSDIVLIAIEDSDEGKQEALLADILNVWSTVDVNIYDLNENPFSCRKVIYSCVNQESSLYQSLLEEAADPSGDDDDDDCDGGACAASVADIEYGINDAVPHSKGGELLCPGNNISEGFVRLEHIGRGGNEELSTQDEAVVYVGLNNGNGRGSLDTFWVQNGFPDEE